MVGSFVAGPARVLSDTGLVRDMSVVDLCCGDGWFTLPIAQEAREVIASTSMRNCCSAPPSASPNAA
jgi:methylase of polypeptide subunit release factors